VVLGFHLVVHQLVWRLWPVHFFLQGPSGAAFTAGRTYSSWLLASGKLASLLAWRGTCQQAPSLSYQSEGQSRR